MDENHISKEVYALIERMEQFPHEFIGYDSPWCDVLKQLIVDEGELPFLLTAEESRVLKEAYRMLLRRQFSEAVVERIVNPSQAAFPFMTDNDFIYKKEFRDLASKIAKPKAKAAKCKSSP